MSGPVALLWLALVLPPIPGGGHADAPGVDAIPTAIPAPTLATSPDGSTSPCWERPARRSRSHHQGREVDHSIPATETEKEKKGESSGGGPEGMSPLAIIPIDPAGAVLASSSPCTDPRGCAGRSVTRLRC